MILVGSILGGFHRAMMMTFMGSVLERTTVDAFVSIEIAAALRFLGMGIDHGVGIGLA